MKKILLASLIIVTAGFAAYSVASKSEAKTQEMQKVQENAQSIVKENSSQEIQDQVQNPSKEANSSKE